MCSDHSTDRRGARRRFGGLVQLRCQRDPRLVPGPARDRAGRREPRRRRVPPGDGHVQRAARAVRRERGRSADRSSGPGRPRRRPGGDRRGQHRGLRDRRPARAAGAAAGSADPGGPRRPDRAAVADAAACSGCRARSSSTRCPPRRSSSRPGSCRTWTSSTSASRAPRRRRRASTERRASSAPPRSRACACSARTCRSIGSPTR